MKDITKYRGIIPAFYACYAPDGSISTERVKALTRHLIAKGVKGVYVGGSSGECIYQHPDERKAVLEAVMSEAKGKITVIAHVACNNTADSVELAAHAEKCGVDAIASIPPIYFHLPNDAIAAYWNAMSAAAPNTEFVIYNIPQLAGTALTMPLLHDHAQEPQRHRRQEQLHAHPGYPAVQGCRHPGPRRGWLRRVQRSRRAVRLRPRHGR